MEAHGCTVVGLIRQADPHNWRHISHEHDVFRLFSVTLIMVPYHLMKNLFTVALKGQNRATIAFKGELEKEKQFWEKEYIISHDFLLSQSSRSLQY